MTYRRPYVCKLTNCYPEYPAQRNCARASRIHGNSLWALRLYRCEVDDFAAVDIVLTNLLIPDKCFAVSVSTKPAQGVWVMCVRQPSYFERETKNQRPPTSLLQPFELRPSCRGKNKCSGSYRENFCCRKPTAWAARASFQCSPSNTSVS